MSTSKDDGEFKSRNLFKGKYENLHYAIFFDVSERSFTHYRNYLHATITAFVMAICLLQPM
jgi:hypothetical protein